MLDHVVYRFKQLVFALSAQMTEGDRAFVRPYLDIKESALFFSLPEFEQKHSVVVAQKMAGEAKGKHDLDQRRLIRLGLLHDIGKAATRLSIFDKGVLVILHRIIPPLYNLFAYFGTGEKAPSLFRKFYVHKHHGLIGSRMLEQIGGDRDIVNAIAQHDRPHCSEDSYMQILDRADSSY